MIGVRKEADLLEILHFNCGRLPAVSLPSRWDVFLSQSYTCNFWTGGMCQ